MIRHDLELSVEVEEEVLPSRNDTKSARWHKVNFVKPRKTYDKTPKHRHHPSRASGTPQLVHLAHPTSKPSGLDSRKSSSRMPRHPTLQRIVDPVLIARTNLPRVHVPQEPCSLLPRQVGLTDVQKVRSEPADEPFVEDLEDGGGASVRERGGL
jgi:hypothetical protein